MKRFFCALFLVLGLASRGSAQPGPPVPTAATIPVFTVATLPAASSMTGRTVMVWDGATGGTCTAGGGGYRNLCQSNGASWITLSGGGSVPEGRTLTATAPLTGGGDLTANRAFACPTCEITTRKGAANGYAGLDVGGVVLSSQGGTGNAFTKFTGPTTTEKTFTLPNESATLGYFSGTPGTGFVTKSDATGLVTASAISTGYSNERRGSGYASLNALVAAHNAQTPSVLPEQAIIDGTLPWGGSGTLTVPATLTLVKRGNGKITCTGATAGQIVILGAIVAEGELFDKTTCTASTPVVFTGNNKIPRLTPLLWGAAGDNSTDDTAPIKAMIYAVDSTGIVLWFDRMYLANTTTAPSGWGTDVFFLIKDNITIDGNGKGGVRTTANARLFAISGGAKDGNLASIRLYGISPYNPTVYNLTGTQTRGDYFVTLATAGEAANFAAGDYIYIRTGNIGVSTSQPDSELNVVTAVDAGTGVISLQKPLAKTYQQEYFISGTAGDTSTTPTANLAIYGVSKVTDRTISNITIRNVRLISSGNTSASNQVLVGSQIDNWLIENVYCETANGFHSFGNYRNARFLNNTIIDTRSSGVANYWLATATGVTDVLMQGNIGIGRGMVHIHEGSARITISNNFWQSAKDTADTAVTVSIRGRGYDIRVLGNTVYANRPTSAQPAIRVDSNVTDGEIANNTVDGAGGIAVFATDPTQWKVHDNVLLKDQSMLAPAGTTYTRTKTLTDGTPDPAVNLFNINLTPAQRAGGVIHYSIEASNGTEHQVLTGMVLYAAENKSAAEVVVFSTPVEALQATAGTLTAAWSYTSGTSLATVVMTPNGSLTETTYQITYTITFETSQSITPVP